MKNYLVVGDKKRSLGFLRTELNSLRLSYILSDSGMCLGLSLFVFFKFQRFSSNSSSVGLSNSCFVTGSSGSVYSAFGLTRFVLRSLGLKGALVGISKSSW